MVSIWWLAYAFLMGGLAGALVFALMTVAKREDERATLAEKAIALQQAGLPDVDYWKAWRSHKPGRSLASGPSQGLRRAA